MKIQNYQMETLRIAEKDAKSGSRNGKPRELEKRNEEVEI